MKFVVCCVLVIGFVGEFLTETLKLQKNNIFNNLVSQNCLRFTNNAVHHVDCVELERGLGAVSNKHEQTGTMWHASNKRVITAYQQKGLDGDGRW